MDNFRDLCVVHDPDIYYGLQISVAMHKVKYQLNIERTRMTILFHHPRLADNGCHSAIQVWQ